MCTWREPVVVFWSQSPEIYLKVFEKGSERDFSRAVSLKQLFTAFDSKMGLKHLLNYQKSQRTAVGANGLKYRPCP